MLAPAATGARVRVTVSRRANRGTFVPVATARPAADVLRDLRRDVPPEPEAVELVTGDRVRVEVESDRAGFVTVFNVGPTGNLNLLAPAKPGLPAVAVEAGRPLQVLDVRLTPPAGRERLVALWTREPLALRRDELRTLAEQGEVPVTGPARTTRDLELVQESVEGLTAGEWEAAVVELRHLAPEAAVP
jgi:hypothetical protein